MTINPADSSNPARQSMDFHAWRIRLLKRGRILCLIALPIGLYLGEPFVWILALAGIIIASIKLRWLSN